MSWDAIVVGSGFGAAFAARPLVEAGLARVRLSPQDCDMVRVAALYRAALDGRISGDAALAGLADVYPGAHFSNGFLHQREGAAWVSRGRSAALGHG